MRAILINQTNGGSNSFEEFLGGVPIRLQFDGTKS
jgi:hypothetical protein